MTPRLDSRQHSHSYRHSCINLQSRSKLTNDILCVCALLQWVVVCSVDPNIHMLTMTAGRVLGGKITFIGAVHSLEIVLMRRLDQDNTELPLNAHQLPASITARPDDDEASNNMTEQSSTTRGDILIVRMAEGAQPLNFTLKEWD